MPAEDLRLIIPNGCVKLSIAIRNGIIASVNGTSFTSSEHHVSLTGLIDVPVILDAQEDLPTTTIVVEFKPGSAYRFFGIKFLDIRNRIESLTDVLGKVAVGLEKHLTERHSLPEKLDAVQVFLLRQLNQHGEDSIFEYCVSSILASKGRMTIKMLETKMGYSSRWINTKFQERLGVSAKNLLSITRFNHYYKAAANNHEQSFMQHDLYNLYYDQSHFLKEFKRFTGRSHAGFTNASNDFGKLFYRD